MLPSRADGNKAITQDREEKISYYLYKRCYRPLLSMNRQIIARYIPNQ
jgi:hypothetical protein